MMAFYGFFLKINTLGDPRDYIKAKISFQHLRMGTSHSKVFKREARVCIYTELFLSLPCEDIARRMPSTNQGVDPYQMLKFAGTLILDLPASKT